MSRRALRHEYRPSKCERGLWQGPKKSQSKINNRHDHPPPTHVRQLLDSFSPTTREPAAVPAMSAPDPLALERAGFSVSEHNGGKHWVLKGRGIRADYWPTAGKFQVFGKVFRASVQDFIQAAQAGQYTKPDKPAVRCKRCHAPIYWAKTHNGKWTPLDSDGGSHMAHCRRVQ